MSALSTPYYTSTEMRARIGAIRRKLAEVSEKFFHDGARANANPEYEKGLPQLAKEMDKLDEALGDWMDMYGKMPKLHGRTSPAVPYAPAPATRTQRRRPRSASASSPPDPKAPKK